MLPPAGPFLELAANPPAGAPRRREACARSGPLDGEAAAVVGGEQLDLAAVEHQLEVVAGRDGALGRQAGDDLLAVAVAREVLQAGVGRELVELGGVDLLGLDVEV